MIEFVRMRQSNSDSQLPQWSNWGAYLKDGFFYYLGLIKYFLVIMIPIILFIALFIVMSISFPEADNHYYYPISYSIFSLIFALTIILQVILGMLISIMKPYFLLSYVVDGNTNNFYNFRKMWHFIKDIPFLFLISTGLIYGIFNFRKLLLLIPVLGWSIFFGMMLIIANLSVIMKEKSTIIR